MNLFPITVSDGGFKAHLPKCENRRRKAYLQVEGSLAIRKTAPVLLYLFNYRAALGQLRRL